MIKSEIEKRIAELERQIQMEYQNLGKAILECTRRNNVRVDAMVDKVIALKQQLLQISAGDDEGP